MINELDELSELDELEDFEIPQANYEVWVLGYDQFDMPTTFEYLIGSFTNPDAAIDRAKTLLVSDITKENNISDTIAYFNIEVETTAEGLNIGTVYRRQLENTRSSIELWIKETDYELTEEGNLKVTCQKIKPLKVGDYLSVKISHKPDTEPILLKVLTKETGSITCEFVD